MKLHIANTTKQRHDFTFRRLEKSNLVHHPIRAGEQSIVLDGTTDEIDYILKQHEIYGLIDATRIDQSKAYIGLCYSIDKPVASKIIEKAMRDNDQHLTRKSNDHRQASAFATSEKLRSEDSGFHGDLEVSAEQRLKTDEDPRDTDFVNETISVEGEKKGSGKKK
ncbi:hypothetical protein ACE2AK_04185 [Rahnella perminowiae]|uniref:hypothetical protein n=1 Tax=Rahnella perminowiae TaxID=2816244 RepID=UPI001C2712BF|nr:hypothetical protein [Rahnella perminowiae]MBU9812376.1 hypothetical protein [Rahnella perminowiae]